MRPGKVYFKRRKRLNVASSIALYQSSTSFVTEAQSGKVPIPACKGIKKVTKDRKVQG
jgi:hypothetical protein